MYSLEARMAHKGWQESGAADGCDINTVAPAGLAEPSILCRHSVVLLCLSQATSKIPPHILPTTFRLHRSSGSPACRILADELCPEPRRHLRQGRGALPSVRAGAGRDYRSQHAAACLSSSSSSSALPGRAQAGMLQAALEQASAGHVPGGPGTRRRQPRCR